jgi:hypothetical protein
VPATPAVAEAEQQPAAPAPEAVAAPEPTPAPDIDWGKLPPRWRLPEPDVFRPVWPRHREPDPLWGNSECPSCHDRHPNMRPRPAPRTIPKQCATEFSDWPLCLSLPSEYVYSSSDAALREMKRVTGKKNLKLHNKSATTEGPCVGVGTHWNVRDGSEKVGSIACLSVLHRHRKGPGAEPVVPDLLGMSDVAAMLADLRRAGEARLERRARRRSRCCAACRRRRAGPRRRRGGAPPAVVRGPPSRRRSARRRLRRPRRQQLRHRLRRAAARPSRPDADTAAAAATDAIAESISRLHVRLGALTPPPGVAGTTATTTAPCSRPAATRRSRRWNAPPGASLADELERRLAVTPVVVQERRQPTDLGVALCGVVGEPERDVVSPAEVEGREVRTRNPGRGRKGRPA